jgi:hypothetical protein
MGRCEGNRRTAVRACRARCLVSPAFWVELLDGCGVNGVNDDVVEGTYHVGQLVQHKRSNHATSLYNNLSSEGI